MQYFLFGLENVVSSLEISRMIDTITADMFISIA